MQQRFKDQNLKLSDFEDEIWLVCPSCARKAIATTNHETNIAKLICTSCGYNSEKSMVDNGAVIKMPANYFFDLPYWLEAPFKNERFVAYNLRHLDYLEQYISATLREHQKRTGFTMVEKLPKFMQVAKNRVTLLKIILKLKNK